MKSKVLGLVLPLYLEFHISLCFLYLRGTRRGFGPCLRFPFLYIRTRLMYLFHIFRQTKTIELTAFSMSELLFMSRLKLKYIMQLWNTLNDQVPGQLELQFDCRVAILSRGPHVLHSALISRRLFLPSFPFRLIFRILIGPFFG